MISSASCTSSGSSGSSSSYLSIPTPYRTASALRSRHTIMPPPSRLSLDAHVPWCTHMHTSTTRNASIDTCHRSKRELVQIDHGRGGQLRGTFVVGNALRLSRGWTRGAQGNGMGCRWRSPSEMEAQREQIWTRVRSKLGKQTQMWSFPIRVC